jgi:hypothetical protein
VSASKERRELFAAWCCQLLLEKAKYMKPTRDTELLLLTSIFQSAHPITRSVGGELNGTEYLQFCAPDIERLGRVFKLLGLAEVSTQSALGWKPTAHLLDIIGQRAARPTKASHKQETAKEHQFVESLFELAGGDPQEPEITEDFLFSVLNALGLLQEGRGGGCKPTFLLQETFEDIFAA